MRAMSLQTVLFPLFVGGPEIRRGAAAGGSRHLICVGCQRTTLGESNVAYREIGGQLFVLLSYVLHLDNRTWILNFTRIIEHGYITIVGLFDNDEQNAPQLRDPRESPCRHVKIETKKSAMRQGLGPHMSICEHSFGGTQIYGPSFFPFRLN